MRVVGIVSGLSDNSELTKFFSPGDEVRSKTSWRKSRFWFQI